MMHFTSHPIPQYTRIVLVLSNRLQLFIYLMRMFDKYSIKLIKYEILSILVYFVCVFLYEFTMSICIFNKQWC